MKPKCSFVVFPPEIAEKKQSSGGEQAAVESLAAAVWLCSPQYVLHANEEGR